MTDTPPYRTKLIEVGLPLEAINKACVQEKSIRHGHPSTLHLYWARRPLAGCRAVLFSSLVDDPSSDPLYKDKSEEEIQARRQELHDLLSELVLWESTTNEKVINRARAEIASSLSSFASEKGEISSEDWPGVIERTAKPKLVNKYLVEVVPPVLDPFAGGGSIPLEAQRLGLRAYASDLNPVPVLINKALIEIPPKFSGQPPVNPEMQSEDGGMKTWEGAAGLAEDVRYYAEWIKNKAFNKQGYFYPQIEVTQELVDDHPGQNLLQGEKLTIAVWVWANTVPSPNPVAKGFRVPLVSSFWLNNKKGKEIWISPKIIDNIITYEIKANAPPKHLEQYIKTGTKIGRGGNFKCLLTEDPLPVAYIREVGQEGLLKQDAIAIICESTNGRVYISPKYCPGTQDQIEHPDRIPSELIAKNPRDIRCQLYGMYNFSELFTKRQLSILCTLSDLITEVHQEITSQHPDNDQKYADSISLYLSFALSRCVDYWSRLTSWSAHGFVAHTFGRQAIAMVWDFAEVNPFSNSTGNWTGAVKWVTNVIERLPANTPSLSLQHDATKPYSFLDKAIISTDPPYYDNICYADLSDYFYVWLKRTLCEIMPDAFQTVLTPKSDELIASTTLHDGDKQKAFDFFESCLGTAIEQMHRASLPDIPITIFYAYKQTEETEEGTRSSGWETFLTGLLKANLQITSTWPLRTERTIGIKGSINALSTSIVLSCRPRHTNAEVVTRAEFVKTLRKNLGLAVETLQLSAIAPVDLQQASIGPGMAVFTRYEKVLENDGSAMTVRSALGLINQVLDEVLVEQEGEFDADTRFAVVWFEQFGFETSEYGTAQVLATSKGISPEGVCEAGILEVGGGKCRLLSIDELEPNWNPETDSRRTVWEVTHYLCKSLSKGGIEEAAKLLTHVMSDADAARDLSYRLFAICVKKKMPNDALLYNSLVASWADMLKVASSLPSLEQREEVSTLFDE